MKGTRFGVSDHINYVFSLVSQWLFCPFIGCAWL